MNNNDMKQVERRVRRYWYSDGIAELASGGMFLLLGLYFGVLGYFEAGSLVSVILQVSMVLVFIGGAFGVRWLVNTLKSRLTYPRTGYVEYRAKDGSTRKRRWVIVGSVMAITAVSVVLVDYFRVMESMVFITGLLVGVIFIALRGKSSGLLRFYALGGLAIVLGLALAYSGLPQIYTLSFFYGLLGIAILISGGLVLRGYLAENPSRSENDNG
jgi:membrane protein YdbS with pleckstrin-like domain